MKSFKSILFFLVLIAATAGAFYYFNDTEPPTIIMTPGEGAITKKTVLHLNLEDNGSGLAQANVAILQNGKQFQVLNKNYPQGTVSAAEEIDLSRLMLQDGNISVVVTCGDSALYNMGKGNSGDRVFNLVRDTRPPLITVLSTAHNINTGGCALVVYSVNEEITASGVTIGDNFFPGFKQANGVYQCLFAFPYSGNSKVVPRVIATDTAGNKGIGGFYYHLNRRRFRVDSIKISDRFLNSKMPQFQDMFPAAQTPLEVFLAVNRKLRPQNRAQLHNIAAKTASSFTWDKVFIRQPNAATRATFGDLRHYIYKGKEIDQQRHLGIDLASTARARVPASNSGTVVFADFMGIYGQCIIIDHGLGLQTLYAHLSSMEVNIGERVERGQIIARTGATGLAGGDHLHFGVVVGGVPVNPVEWWDKNWVKNNITAKLNITAD